MTDLSREDLFAELAELRDAVRPVVEAARIMARAGNGHAALSCFEQIGHGGGRAMTLSWSSLNRALVALGMDKVEPKPFHSGGYSVAGWGVEIISAGGSGGKPRVGGGIGDMEV